MTTLLSQQPKIRVPHHPARLLQETPTRERFRSELPRVIAWLFVAHFAVFTLALVLQ